MLPISTFYSAYRTVCIFIERFNCNFKRENNRGLTPTAKLRTPVLIIDDNPLLREILSDLIEDNHSELELVGTAANGTEAVQLIQLRQPDLVFLDVEMPDMTGFEVLQRLENIDFQVIFVTAHQHYAINAIRFNALDYLVKPVDPTELKQAVKRFHLRKSNKQKEQIKLALVNLQQEEPQQQRLFIPSQEGGEYLQLANILFLEGNRNYTIIHRTNGRRIIAAKTLAYFEDILSDKAFFRIHRSFLLNRSQLKGWEGEQLVLQDGKLLPVSRRRKKAVREWMKDI